MKNTRIVVALGGNAILSKDPTAQAQQAALQQTADYLVTLVEHNNEVLITHGNGPQVGNLLLQNIAAHSPKNPALPLDSLVAMTEGSIGYWLQNALQNSLLEKGITHPVCSLITQVLVDPHDPAFQNPTKPIGPFYTEDDAKKEMAQSNVLFKEDAGRGWRKVVASPKPIAIKEIETIKTLLENNTIVVAAGGGGIPVVEQQQQLKGVEAVIDKDFASEVLAQDVEADVLIILTGVDYVYLNYNQPDQQQLSTVTVSEMMRYIEQDHFSPGAMLPKVQAAIQFVQNHPRRRAVITSLENLQGLIERNEGTIIIDDQAKF